MGQPFRKTQGRGVHGSARVPPWAEIAFLTTAGDAIDVAFRRIPYDCPAAVRAMAEREMPHWVWWSDGWC